MSIAQGTPHYGYPQVQLNDRPTFADFNPAFEDIDAKLYGLITGAETDEQAIRDLSTEVSNLVTEVGRVSGVATDAKNKSDANEEAITLLSGQVSQNTTKLGTKIDSNAIAEPYDTSVTYDVGDVVTYQGQRYRCITAVTVAEPFDATKWTGEDVETVLEHLQSEIDDIPTEAAASNVTLAPITGMTANNVQDGIAELKAGLTAKEIHFTNVNSSVSDIAGTEISGVKNIHIVANNIPTGTWTTLAVISDYRPSIKQVFTVISGTGTHFAEVAITTAGGITIFAPVGDSFEFNWTYI